LPLSTGDPDLAIVAGRISVWCYGGGTAKVTPESCRVAAALQCRHACVQEVIDGGVRLLMRLVLLGDFEVGLRRGFWEILMGIFGFVVCIIGCVCVCVFHHPFGSGLLRLWMWIRTRWTVLGCSVKGRFCQDSSPVKSRVWRSLARLRPVGPWAGGCVVGPWRVVVRFCWWAEPGWPGLVRSIRCSAVCLGSHLASVV